MSAVDHLSICLVQPSRNGRTLPPLTARDLARLLSERTYGLTTRYHRRSHTENSILKLRVPDGIKVEQNRHFIIHDFGQRTKFCRFQTAWMSKGYIAVTSRGAIGVWRTFTLGEKGGDVIVADCRRSNRFPTPRGAPRYGRASLPILTRHELRKGHASVAFQD